MSEPKLKNGRLPASTRPSPSSIKNEDVFGAGQFEIPDHIKEDMAKRGLTPRWLNASEVYKNQGYHKRGWKIYRDTNPDFKRDFQFGKDPEGVIRRGDCILGYKEPESSSKHKAFLKQSRDNLMGFTQRHKEDMAVTAKELKSKIMDFDPESDD